MSYLILVKGERHDGCAVWWRPDRNGYTTDVSVAGRYSIEDARSIAGIRGTDIPVHHSELGKSLLVRGVVRDEDASNFTALRQIEASHSSLEGKQ